MWDGYEELVEYLAPKSISLDSAALDVKPDPKELAEAQYLLNNADQKAADVDVETDSYEYRTGATLTTQSMADEVKEAQNKAAITAAEEQANKVRGDNNKRDAMFKWALTLVSLMLLFTIIFMLWYMTYAMHVKNELPELVLVTWMGTTVVEAIGIALIIAKYLFPGELPEPKSD